MKIFCTGSIQLCSGTRKITAMEPFAFNLRRTFPLMALSNAAEMIALRADGYSFCCSTGFVSDGAVESMGPRATSEGFVGGRGTGGVAAVLASTVEAAFGEAA